jgi:hypothetical protein
MSRLLEDENMSQPDAQPVPNYVTCPCQHCSGKIEFDANQLDAVENTTVPCPHCGLETKISVLAGESLIKQDNQENHRAWETYGAMFRAAEKGDPQAQFEVGLGFQNGQTGTDYYEALKWMKLAAAQGYERARKKCEELELFLKNNAERISKPPANFSRIGEDEEIIQQCIEVIRSNKKASVSLLNKQLHLGYTITKAPDLAGPLTNLEAGDVLFIDEIHRLQRTIEEYLYQAMKDFQLDIILDQGPNARSVRLNLPRFTLIGSTTTKERLTPNLLSCFRIIENMDDYSIDELAAIARRFATSMEVEIDATRLTELHVRQTARR